MTRSRRFWLAGTTWALSLTGMTAWAMPFVQFLSPSSRARARGAPVQVDISRLNVGSMKVIGWRGKPVYIIRRTPRDVAQLEHIEAQLKDPESVAEQQPSYARNRNRSIKPEILVVEGVCTHLGCTPKYRADDSGTGFRGLYCPCHGSKFDFAGRVYDNVPAPTNLRVPPHRYTDEGLLVIGSDGEVV